MKSPTIFSMPGIGAERRRPSREEHVLFAAVAREEQRHAPITSALGVNFCVRVNAATSAVSRSSSSTLRSPVAPDGRGGRSTPSGVARRTRELLPEECARSLEILLLHPADVVAVGARLREVQRLAARVAS